MSRVTAASRLVIADCDAGGNRGAGASAPYPDSQTAEVDSDSAEPDNGLPSIGSVGSNGLRSSALSAAADSCAAEVGGVALPTRIDAGAGGTAAARSWGVAGAGAALVAAVTEGVRRRRRH